MDDTTTRRTPLSKGERRLIWATAIFVLVVGGVGGWWYWINLPPTVTIPPQVLPVPNGFDTMQSAKGNITEYMSFGTGKLQHDLSISDVKHTIDGNIFYQRNPSGPPVTITERKVLMSHNAAALSIFQRALTEQFVVPFDKARDGESLSPIRNLLDIAMATGAMSAAEGNRRQAVKQYLDCLDGAVTVAQGGGLSYYYFGSRRQRVCRIELWKAVDKVPFDTTGQSARRLVDMAIRCKSYPAILQEEKRVQQSLLLDCVSQPGWRKISKDNAIIFWNLYGIRDMMTSLGQYFDTVIEEAKRQPYYIKSTLIQPSWMRLVRNEFEIEIFGVIHGTKCYFYQNNLQHNLLTLAFALRAHRLKYGAYPADLAALAPEFIPTIPTDPFARNAPLHYQRKGSAYLLYSVGPDGKDDGGAPSADGHFPVVKRGTGAVSTPLLNDNSTGDIVAGVNVN